MRVMPDDGYALDSRAASIAYIRINRMLFPGAAETTTDFEHQVKVGLDKLADQIIEHARTHRMGPYGRTGNTA